MTGAIGFELPLILAAAFGAGFIDSMVGGGGLIQVPALFSAFPASAPATLLGTNKAASLLGTISAVARYARRVRLPWLDLLPFAAVSVILSLAGAFTATRVPPEVLRPLVPVILAAVLVYVLRRRDFGALHRPERVDGRRQLVAYALIAAIAFYEGFLGPGTGSFFMFVFIRLFGYDFLHAAAGARLLNAAANAAALAWFGVYGHVLWAIALGMAVCNLAGALTGTRFALRHGSGFVRKVFAVVVSALLARALWEALR